MKSVCVRKHEMDLVLPAVEKISTDVVSDATKQREHNQVINAKIQSAVMWDYNVEKSLKLNCL